MMFGVCPTKNAVVIARTTGSGNTFAITSITSIEFQTRSGDDLTELLRRLVDVFNREGKRPGARRSHSSRPRRAGSSLPSKPSRQRPSRSSPAVESGLPVVRVTAASLKTALGCTPGQKWQARAAERFNSTGRYRNWSPGAAGAAAAALKVAAGSPGQRCAEA